MAEPAPPVAEPGPPYLDVVALQDELRGLSEQSATYVRLIQSAYLEARAERDTATALLREARLDVEPGLDPKFLRARIDSFLGGQEQ